MIIYCTIQWSDPDPRNLLGSRYTIVYLLSWIVSSWCGVAGLAGKLCGRIAGWLGLDRLGAYLRLNGLSVLHLADGSVIFRPLGREVLPASSWQKENTNWINANLTTGYSHYLYTFIPLPNYIFNLRLIYSKYAGHSLLLTFLFGGSGSEILVSDPVPDPS